MMLIDCPACGYGFVHRRGKRCPRCRILIVKPGERYVRQGDPPEPVWVMVPDEDR